MKIKNITNTKAMFAHQPICDNLHLKSKACELLFRGFEGAELQDFLDDPSLFVSHLDALVEAKALSILSLYETDNYSMFFINFTPCQIASPLFIPSLEWFDKNNIPPSSIVIEVTELPLRDEDLQGFLYNLALLREKGHLIALDDFGAGASNFNRLLLLQPDIVKLDTNLLRLAEKSQYHKHALRALITFTHEIGSKCIIEGIETESLLSIARNSGADFFQGYYLGRPTLIVHSAKTKKVAFDEYKQQATSKCW
jgi:EAL domain-containing protein (putative c-di-GMP-specific phosphodiesterase class I)